MARTRAQQRAPEAGGAGDCERRESASGVERAAGTPAGQTATDAPEPVDKTCGGTLRLCPCSMCPFLPGGVRYLDNEELLTHAAFDVAKQLRACGARVGAEDAGGGTWAAGDHAGDEPPDDGDDALRATAQQLVGDDAHVLSLAAQGATLLAVDAALGGGGADEVVAPTAEEAEGGPPAVPPRSIQAAEELERRVVQRLNRGKLLREGSSVTLTHLLLALAALKVQSAWSDASAERLLVFLKPLLHLFGSPAAPYLPVTWDAVKSVLAPLTPDTHKFNVCGGDCGCGHVFAGPQEAICTACRGQPQFEIENGKQVPVRPGFIKVDWPLQLFSILRKPDVAASLVSPHVSSTDGVTRTISDTCAWKSAMRWVAEEKDFSQDELQHVLMLGLTCDGVQPFGRFSRKYSVWFIMAEILNLHPSIRRKPENMIVLGISLGPSQPKDLQSVFRLFVPELNDAFHRGVPVYDGHQKRAVLAYPLLYRLYGDGPAIVKMANRYSHSGTCGCPYCLLRAVSKHGHRVFDDVDLRAAGKRPRPKTHEYVQQIAAGIRADLSAGKDVDADQKATGIHGPCWVEDLVYSTALKLLEAFRVDLMHLIGNITGELYDTLQRTCTAADLASMRARCGDIKLPQTCSLASMRVMSTIGLSPPEWKTHDKVVLVTSGMLQFVALGHVRPEIYAAISAICEVIKKLCAVAVDDALLDELEKETTAALALWRQVFPGNMSLQFHELHHVAEQMRIDGAAVGYWCFPHEQMYGVITGGAHGTRQVEANLVNTAMTRTTLQSAKSTVSADGDIWTAAPCGSRRVGDVQLGRGGHYVQLETDELKTLDEAAERAHGITIPRGGEADSIIVRRYASASVHGFDFLCDAGRQRGSFDAGVQALVHGVLLYGVIKHFDVVLQLEDTSHAVYAAVEFYNFSGLASDDIAELEPFTHVELHAPCVPQDSGGTARRCAYIAINELCGTHGRAGVLKQQQREGVAGECLVLVLLPLSPIHFSAAHIEAHHGDGVAARLLPGARAASGRRVRWPSAPAQPPGGGPPDAPGSDPDSDGDSSGASHSSLSRGSTPSSGIEAVYEPGELPVELPSPAEKRRASRLRAIERTTGDIAMLEDTLLVIKGKIKRHKAHIQGWTAEVQGQEASARHERQLLERQREIEPMALASGSPRRRRKGLRCRVHGLNILCDWGACNAACCRVQRRGAAGQDGPPRCEVHDKLPRRPLLEDSD